MKLIIKEGIKQDASFERIQAKSIAQLHKEYKIYGYRIEVLKRGYFARVKELKQGGHI